jgi:hypothetical protein
MKRILSELIASTPVIKDGKGRPKRPTAEQIADHLIANNVIVLPCAIGSTVWIVSKNCTEPYPAKFKLDDVSQIGKRIFLRREDALRRMRGVKR